MQNATTNEVGGTRLAELGRRFGGKDHTTMLYSIRKIEKLLNKDRSVKKDVDRLLHILTSK